MQSSLSDFLLQLTFLHTPSNRSSSPICLLYDFTPSLKELCVQLNGYCLSISPANNNCISFQIFAIVGGVCCFLLFVAIKVVLKYIYHTE